VPVWCHRTGAWPGAAGRRRGGTSLSARDPASRYSAASGTLHCRARQPRPAAQAGGPVTQARLSEAPSPSQASPGLRATRTRSATVSLGLGFRPGRDSEPDSEIMMCRPGTGRTVTPARQESFKLVLVSDSSQAKKNGSCRRSEPPGLRARPCRRVTPPVTMCG
jgi:hypothetical protein